MSGMHDDVDLGHTIAGWTGCAIALSGCATVGVAMCAGSLPAVWIGLGVIVLGGLTTWALHLAGWGKPSGPRPPDQWDWRQRDPMTGHGRCLACRLAARGGGERGLRQEGGGAVTTGAAVPEEPALRRAQVLTDR